MERKVKTLYQIGLKYFLEIHGMRFTNTTQELFGRVDIFQTSPTLDNL